MTDAQNSKTSAKKKRGKPFEEGDDPRRNKGGRPKNAVSLTAIARDYLSIKPYAIADQLKSLASRYRQIGNDATMAHYVMGSFLLAVYNDPQPGNMRELWRRIDGEVASINVDVSQLTDDQLKRLADGEDIYSVLAYPGASGDGTPQAREDNAESSG